MRAADGASISTDRARLPRATARSGHEWTWQVGAAALGRNGATLQCARVPRGVCRRGRSAPSIAGVAGRCRRSVQTISRFQRGADRRNAQGSRLLRRPMGADSIVRRRSRYERMHECHLGPLEQESRHPTLIRSLFDTAMSLARERLCYCQTCRRAARPRNWTSGALEYTAARRPACAVSNGVSS